MNNFYETLGKIVYPLVLIIIFSYLFILSISFWIISFPISVLCGILLFLYMKDNTSSLEDNYYTKVFEYGLLLYSVICGILLAILLWYLFIILIIGASIFFVIVKYRKKTSNKMYLPESNRKSKNKIKNQSTTEVYKITSTRKRVVSNYSSREFNKPESKSHEKYSIEDESRALYEKGNIYLDAKEYTEALKLFKVSLKKDPSKSIVWCSLSECYYKLGVYDKAILAANGALDINPHNVDALIKIGDAYIKLNEYKKASTSYKKVIEIDAKSEEAWERLEKLNDLKDKSEIEILRGGDWKVEGNQSVFYFKVKIQNTTDFIISNIYIILTSVPDGLKTNNDSTKYTILNPGDYISPSFKLYATESCVGSVIKGIVTYLDSKSISKTVNIEPLKIKYVCSLLVPEKITQKDFEKRISSMEGKSISFPCEGSLSKIKKVVEDVIKDNNFYLLKNQNEQTEELCAFAKGLYDKEEVALAACFKEQDNNWNLTIEAVSSLEGKTTDILKDLSYKLDEIKDVVELIEVYMPQLEEKIVDVAVKLDEVEDYLIKSLGTEFTKIKHLWKQYKDKEIGLGKFLKGSIKIVGKAMIKKAVKGMIKKFLIPL